MVVREVGERERKKGRMFKGDEGKKRTQNTEGGVGARHALLANIARAQRKDCRAEAPRLFGHSEYLSVRLEAEGGVCSGRVLPFQGGCACVK